MANETNQYMNQDRYSVSNQVFTSENGNLTYAPKKWETEELIETIEMNNIEQGIQIALESRDTMQRIASEAVAQVNATMGQINDNLDRVQSNLNDINDAIDARVNNTLTTQNSNLINLLQQIIGTTYYQFDSLTYTRPQGTNTIDTRITELYDEVFGTGSSGSTSSTSLNARIQALTTSVDNLPTTIYDTIGARLGSAYYNSSNHSWAGTYTDDIDSRITTLYNAIFGQSSSGSNKTILEQIEALNTALFGSSSGGTFSGPLIDKVEKAMGRSLNLENGETADATTGEYSNSLSAQINTIKGILGMSGGTSGGNSNLIEKINAMIISIYGSASPTSYDLGTNYTLSRLLDDLYGPLIDDPETGESTRNSNPLLETLKRIPTNMDTLTTKVNSVESIISGTNETLGIDARLRAVEGWENIVDKSYTDAFTFVLQEDEKTYLRLSRNNSAVPTTISQMNADLDNTYILLPEGGGGGAATGGGTAVITRITDTSVQILTGNSCPIEYKLEARDTSNELVGNGTAIWYVGGVQVATSTALNITNSNANLTNVFDIAPYLSIGSNNITLQVSVNTGGEYNTVVRKTWTVSVINFSLVWNYNEETIFNEGTITLEWIPYGANINKTTYMQIDDEEPVAISTTIQSGITQIYTFTHNLTHGVHTCILYLGATINGRNETTTPQQHDLIIVEPSNTTPIISSSFTISSMEQYDTVAIPIVVYTPNSTLTNNVTLSVNNEIVDIWNNVNRELHYWNYSASTTGIKTLKISVGAVEKIISIEVISISIENEEVSGYDFKIKASDIVSNTDLQNNNLLTFSNNFDWINGGLKSERDTNGNIQQYICIKAGTTMTVNKQLFNTDLTNGLNTKIILKTANCSNYDAKILDCYSEDQNIGLEIFSHEARLASSSRSITTQFGENVYLELEFEVYGTSDSPRYMMCWVDGIMSIVRVCDSTDRFRQTVPSDIVIGSTNCDIYIYLIKSYYKKLSINEHIANFIADAPNATTMKTRYNRNDILGDDGEIDYNKLYDAAPDCRIWLYDIPRMTTGKKDYVKGVGFQQLWKNGGKEYYDGLVATNAVLTVQGTSSVNYRKGAANTDIDFSSKEAEGTPTLKSASGENLLADGLAVKGMKLTDSSIPITYSNLKVNFASCEQVNNMCNAAWYQNFQPYPSLSPRDCMEFVMGVQFIKDAGLNEPTVEDPTTHTQMQEVPLFSEKENRDANKYYMYSIGNLGTSKKNTHIFHSEDECCIEVTDNTTLGQRMITWPETLDWTGKVDNMDHSYEFRYPDDPTQSMKNGWERFVRWMAENNPSAATNNNLVNPETYSAYTFKGHNRSGTQVLRGTTVSQYAGTYTTDSFERRMAKMLSECEDYMAMDSVVYHFCFIERHTMVDNVAKNTFWSAAKSNQYINGVEQEDTEGYWIWDLSKNYDNDTSDGNNNEGQLVFDYGNEANDSIGGKMVFNAADSVWFVFISNLTEACATMFINRESANSKDGKYTGAWNSLSYHNFLLSEQQKVPELVWNECYRYSYLRPYERGINTAWISFLDGGQKTHQRRHYETFQELYLASKYMSPLSISNSITLRGYTPQITENMTEEQKAIIRATLAAVPSKSEITITMYNKCYLTVHMGNNFLQQKVEKDVPATLTFRENGDYLILNDTVINIDTASMIQEIGDLSPLYPGQSSFGAAYRLRSIKIGSNEPNYQNLNISATETGAFDFSTNTMLERLEIQNLKAVDAPLSLTGCPALKYLDASGSSFTGYSFADGGLLQVAHLGSPNTVYLKNLAYLTDANLTIDDSTKLRYLTIDNCPEIDSFSRVLDYNNLLSLNLLNLNWEVEGKDFKTMFLKVKDIHEYLLTGTVRLTEDMGTFNIEEIQGYFTNELKIFYVDSQGSAQEYYIIRFYDPYGNETPIRTQYAVGGSAIVYNGSDIFTEEYILAYNKFRVPTWVWGEDTRWGFKQWDKKDLLTNIQSDLDIYPVMDLQWRADFITQTTDPSILLTQSNYFLPGANIISPIVTPFERDYYQYSWRGWTLDNSVENPVILETMVKNAQIDTFYAVYTKNPAVYSINIYTTDIHGEKAGEPLNAEPIRKNAISNSSDPRNDSNVHLKLEEIRNYLPISNNQVTMYGDESEQGVNDENRNYRYLGTQPGLPNNGIRIVGDTDILIKYYYKDDVFTNYFSNKIYNWRLDSTITSFPAYSFNQNSNLTYLKSQVTNLGDYSFINFSANSVQNASRRIFIFEHGANEVRIGNNCFLNAYNCLIIFIGTGQVLINNSFNGLDHSTILMLSPQNNSYPPPIQTSTSPYNGFQFFTDSYRENKLYVPSVTWNNYPAQTSASSSSYPNVPFYLITDEAKNGIYAIESYRTEVNALLREAELDDYQL